MDRDVNAACNILSRGMDTFGPAGAVAGVQGDLPAPSTARQAGGRTGPSAEDPTA